MAWQDVQSFYGEESPPSDDELAEQYDCDGGIERCPNCGAGPLGNCWYFGCETPRGTCPRGSK